MSIFLLIKLHWNEFIALFATDKLTTIKPDNMLRGTETT